MGFNATDTLIRAYEAVLADDWSTVTPLAKTLYASDPNNLEYLQLYGSCLIQKTNPNYTEAIRVFDHAIEIAPESEQVSIGRFHCLMALGRRDDALLECRRYTHLGSWDGYKHFMPPYDEKDFRT